MRTTLTTSIFLVLLAGRQAPPPPAPPAPPPRIFAAIPSTGDSAIEGLVRRLDTGEPLAGAPVVLLGLQDRSGAFPGALSQLEIKTDAAGRFLFEKLPASTYTLRIAPANFFPPPIGGTSASVLSSSVTVSDGQK